MSTQVPSKSISSRLIDWIDSRFPLTKLYNEHMAKYYAPKNFNIWYVFGSLALVVLIIQIISGIFLVMHYKPDGNLNENGLPVAFASVEYIMRDVPGGWFIRYMHSTGASMFFIVIYLHMFRGLVYGSFKKPRELVWIFGFLIFLCLMAEAFMGYLLPWGQMSYWGAQVIINLFQTLPVIGTDLAVWIRGDFNVSDATLNRFFALHACAIPLVLIMLVVIHIIALHEVGSNNPDGVEIKKLKDDRGIPLDGVAFHPYYTVHDILAVTIFLIIFLSIIFFIPEGWGYFLEHPNFEPVNPMATPEHIAPVWYFTPFYAILRAIPSFFGTQVWGVLGMGLAVVLIGFLPWLDRSEVKSIRYRSNIFKFMVILFITSFIGLGILGAFPPTNFRTIISRIFAVIYFIFFLAMPFYSTLGREKVVPSRVTMSTLRRKVIFIMYIFLALILVYIFAKNV